MTDRTRSCEERIGEEQASREQWLRLYFEDLDGLEPHEIITMAVEGDGEGVRFKDGLSDSDRELIEQCANTDDDATFGEEPWTDTEGDPATKGEVIEQLADDARAAIEAFRDEHPEPDVLGVTVTKTIELRVELSTGGPGDFVTAEIDPEDRSVSEVVYHFQDWFDGATRRVPEDSPLHTLVERFADFADLEGGD